MAGTDTEVLEHEDERVRLWRERELVRAGYDSVAAGELAARFDVDLRRAVALLEQGCDPELALRILL